MTFNSGLDVDGSVTYEGMLVLISEIIEKFTSVARSASEAKTSGAITYSWGFGCPGFFFFFGGGL